MMVTMGYRQLEPMVSVQWTIAQRALDSSLGVVFAKAKVAILFSEYMSVCVQTSYGYNSVVVHHLPTIGRESVS